MDAPVYEVWSWHPELGWLFVKYAVLSLRQVLNYQSFGYHVERSHDAPRDVARGADDRGYTPPLFPRLGSATEHP